MEVVEKWLKYIQLHINKSYGLVKMMVACSKMDKFWRVGSNDAAVSYRSTRIHEASRKWRCDTVSVTKLRV